MDTASQSNAVKKEGRRAARGIRACVRCKSRKQRCDIAPNEDTCRSCTKSGNDCIFFDQPQRSIQSTLYVQTLEDTLAKLQAEVERLRAGHPLPSPAATSALSESSPVPVHGGSDAEGAANGQDAARGVAFLSLNAASESHFLGASSGAFWASMVLSQLQLNSRTPGLEVPSIFEKLEDTRPLLSDNAIETISPETSTILFNACYSHVQARYAFMDWLRLQEIMQAKEDIVHAAALPNARRETKSAAFFIWLIIALGAKLCRQMNLNLAPPDDYFAKAMVNLHVIVTLHDLVNLQGLLLMVMYSLRSGGVNSYYLSSIALRLAISMGLHRKPTPATARTLSSYTLELRKRIWWSCFALDRWIALSLGRPLGIADHDIDADLPLNCNVLDPNPTTETEGVTSMSSSLLVAKLRQIEGLIQSTVYRAASMHGRPQAATDADVTCVLAKIHEWQTALPAVPLRSSSTIPHNSMDWFVLRAEEARLYLLRPLIVSDAAESGSKILLAAKAAANACLLHRRYVQASVTNFSLADLHQLFLTALTLLYTVKKKPDALPMRDLEQAIRAASNCLFTYSQQYAAAVVFSNAFEDLSVACLEWVRTPLAQSPTAFAPLALPNLEWSYQLAAASNSVRTDMHIEIENLLQSFGVIDHPGAQFSSEAWFPPTDDSAFGPWSLAQPDFDRPFTL